MNMFRRFSSLDRYTKLTLAVIFFAFLLRLVLAVIYTPAGDGCWYSSVARFIAENGRLPAFEHLGRVVFSYQPLYPLLAGGMYFLFGLLNPGLAAYGIRILNPIFSALALWLIFLIAGHVSSKKVAFYATLFVAFLPIHIYQGYLPYLEALAALLASFAVYFLLKRRFWLGAIAFGLVGLSIPSWFSLLPVMVFMLYVNHGTRNFIKKSVLFLAVSFAIMMPLWIRNIILFRNPVYPYATSLFGDISLPYSVTTFSETAIQPGISTLVNFVVRSYLGLFGVPNGEPSNLFFFNLPFMEILLVGWFIATILYFAPLIYGSVLLFKSKLASHNKLLVIWLLSCLAVPALASLIPGFGVHIRYVLLAAPAIGIIAGTALASAEKIFTSKFLRFAACLALAGIIFGFAAVETVKTVYAASMWSSYTDDFSWIKQNTPSDALFIAPPDQCYPYYFSRPEIGPKNLDWVFSNLNVSYAWVNPQYKPSAARFSDEELMKIEAISDIAYNNTRTGTVIYKIRETAISR